ncbi:MAG TPA: hypothetical protein DIV86_03145 [Alphaproteobacteria bacterium]|nr:hypothetical protein [Alphaproteobacteria bacterium]
MKNKNIKLSLVIAALTTSVFVVDNAISNDSVNNLENSTDQILKTAISKILDNNYEDAPEWFKRIEFEQTLSNNGKPQTGITSVQPIYTSGNNYILNQSRIAYGNDGRTTGNLGLAYRYLGNQDKIIYGVNYFYDFEGPYGHQRSGLGAELKSSAFEVNTNYYHPHTGWRDVDTIYEEHALKGYDAEFGTQLPYMPWAWAFAKGYQYESEINQSENITGAQYSLRLRPFENIELESGYNNNNEAKPSNFLQLRYRIGFNEPNTITKKKSMFASTPFEYGKDMKEKIYEKIRRSNNITVERRVKGATGPTAGGTARVRVSVGS